MQTSVVFINISYQKTSIHLLVSDMTYYVSSGTLNPTHSPIHLFLGLPLPISFKEPIMSF